MMLEGLSPRFPSLLFPFSMRSLFRNARFGLVGIGMPVPKNRPDRNFFVDIFNVC